MAVLITGGIKFKPAGAHGGDGRGALWRAEDVAVLEYRWVPVKSNTDNP